MLDNELIEQFGALPVIPSMTGGDAVFSASEKELINKIHQLLFGKPVRTCTCNHKFSDAAIEINQVLKLKFTNTMEKESQKYILKAGIIIWLGCDAYNRHTITDEVAKKYLELHPDAAEREFDAIPTEEPKDDEKPKRKGGKKAEGKEPKDNTPKNDNGEGGDTEPKDDEKGEGDGNGEEENKDNADGEGDKAPEDKAVRVDTDPEDDD